HALQAHVDAARMDLLLVVEPFGEGFHDAWHFSRPTMTAMSFSVRVPRARVTFSCVAKRKSPLARRERARTPKAARRVEGRMPGVKRRPPRCCVFRPSMDEKSVRAGRACRRAFHGAAASGRNPLRPPCGPFRPALTAAQGPRKSAASRSAILASSEASTNNLLRPARRARRAPFGAPRTLRVDDGSVRRMARRTRASSPQAHGCAFGEPRRPRAHPEHMDVLRTCPRGGLSLGNFSLAKQREVTRAPERGAEKDRDDIRLPSLAASARERWRCMTQDE